MSKHNDRCSKCRKFFAHFQCGARIGQGECDCPPCQGTCKCENVTAGTFRPTPAEDPAEEQRQRDFDAGMAEMEDSWAQGLALNLSKGFGGIFKDEAERLP